MHERALPLSGLLSLLFFACAATAPSGELERRIVAVAEKVTPSVVHIEAIVKINDRRDQVTGSGLIVTADGAILTNEHVVDDAEKITVSVPGRKRKYRARLIGTDQQTDVALLRIDPETPLPAATFSEKDVRVGQWVVAIGNPYGLDGTVSLGIVSAKGRNLEIPELLNDFIQTDALIDRGSSGGPLVDLEGLVVGINSRGQGRGIGFTIPIDTARDVMAQLERGGIERGYLGVAIQALDRDLAEHLGVADASGVLVNHVVPGSPADAAGLETGDVLTHLGVDDVEAEEEEDLGIFQRLIARIPPGEQTSVRYLRHGQPATTVVEIGEQPKLDGAEFEAGFGAHVQEITARLARAHRLTSTDGAFVTFVVDGSPAREAGLRVGDVIVRVEDLPVGDVDAFRAALDSIDEMHRFLLRARRGDEVKYLLVKPRKRGPEDGEVEEADAVARVR
jgi:S1-C subfamily serine protease